MKGLTRENFKTTIKMIKGHNISLITILNNDIVKNDIWNSLFKPDRKLNNVYLNLGNKIT